jgi:hypothetical protein
LEYSFEKILQWYIRGLADSLVIVRITRWFFPVLLLGIPNLVVMLRNANRLRRRDGGDGYDGMVMAGVDGGGGPWRPATRGCGPPMVGLFCFFIAVKNVC